LGFVLVARVFLLQGPVLGAVFTQEGWSHLIKQLFYFPAVGQSVFERWHHGRGNVLAPPLSFVGEGQEVTDYDWISITARNTSGTVARTLHPQDHAAARAWVQPLLKDLERDGRISFFDRGEKPKLIVEHFRSDGTSARIATLSAPAPYRMPTILKCRLRLHFWTTETCLHFAFAVKSKRMVKSFAMVFEHRSQSGVVPPQAIARKN
jgi:hypothetical protein